jgi:hypothetical protein
MQKIDASLFAHIQNDAHLNGTVGLQGSPFAKTIGYLKQFLTHLKAENKFFPKAYEMILGNTDDLVRIQNQIDSVTRKNTQTIELLSKDIATKVLRLFKGQKLFIPGGWSAKGGGHAMVYEFSCAGAEGFNFRAINSGLGLSYHPKKSSTEKELYNPLKSWFFPRPKDEKELVSFIQRLLEPQLRYDLQTEAMSVTKLYQRIFPSISQRASQDKGYEIIICHGCLKDEGMYSRLRSTS